MRHVTLAAAGMIVALVLAAPADARSDREPVTDPLELEALGYLPGTPDIYRLKRAASDPAIVSRQLNQP